MRLPGRNLQGSTMGNAPHKFMSLPIPENSTHPTSFLNMAEREREILDWACSSSYLSWQRPCGSIFHLLEWIFEWLIILVANYVIVEFLEIPCDFYRHLQNYLDKSPSGHINNGIIPPPRMKISLLRAGELHRLFARAREELRCFSFGAWTKMVAEGSVVSVSNLIQTEKIK